MSGQKEETFNVQHSTSKLDERLIWQLEHWVFGAVRKRSANNLPHKVWVYATSCWADPAPPPTPLDGRAREGFRLR